MGYVISLLSLNPSLRSKVPAAHLVSPEHIPLSHRLIYIVTKLLI